jgi:hypothetical protein
MPPPKKYESTKGHGYERSADFELKWAIDARRNVDFGQPGHRA